ncbi:MAG: branched-chain-amino-acid transaminase [Lachnospiraceae bacterium]|nr:branched-chain-amino-acid transaminase [Lachnospiraceae bacterium]
MKEIVLGIVAHVDAGKTTLSESLLFDGGTIRQIGRVDHQDTYLDTAEIERNRGITVFSKQAGFSYGDLAVTLLDTPGHVDFSAEMERSLQVLDYAILVISGLDGVQSHTRTLWKLLREYEVPCFLFINKMDIARESREELLANLRDNLHGDFVDMGALHLADGVVSGEDDALEELAMANEELLEAYSNGEPLRAEMVSKAIVRRDFFPCVFGSALKNEGVEELLQVLCDYTMEPEYGEEFGARVFKIGRDKNGNRLTHVRLIGGSLKNRQEIAYGEHTEKVTEIRLYNGERYESLQEAHAGQVCTLLGLSDTKPGQGLGACDDADVPLMEAVLNYQVIPPEDYPLPTLLANMRQLEEEDPALQVEWLEETKEIHINIMGPVQTEVLQQEIKRRFGVVVTFGPGKILYKETITSPIEGVGHYEPLRHFADVHLLIEPLENGAGIQLASDCSQDVLALNWQRLILTHLGERLHRGTLIGAPITDVKITVIGGRAHIKHTEGGDFRQATYRAVRQGLKKAAAAGMAQILEPFYQVRLTIPQDMIGRAMMDLERMHGTMEPPLIEDGMGVLIGRVPVACIADYGKDVAVYTGGMGQLSLSLAGYYPCHNPEEVMAEKDYDSDRDIKNSCDSVFPAHGVASIVPWFEVESYSPPVLTEVKVEEERLRPAPSEKALSIFRLREHMQRLLNSARIYRINIPYTLEELCEACCKTVRENEIEAGYIRPLAFIGDVGLGVKPPVDAKIEVIIGVVPWGAYLGEEGMKKGVAVGVSSWNRLAPNTIPTGAKAGGNYLSSLLISNEAKQNGYTEGIALDVQGFLAEGSGENVFLIKDGVIYTAPITCSLLPGITRDCVMKLAAELGYQVKEERIPREIRPHLRR